MISIRTSAVLLAALAIGIAGFLVPPAWAHAHLQRANPAAGSTVHAAPPEVRMFFTEKLEPSFSTAKIAGPDGAPVGEAAKVDAGDATQMAVKLTALAPGAYKVVWHAVSVDSHVTDGDFSFTVAP